MKKNIFKTGLTRLVALCLFLVAGYAVSNAQSTVPHPAIVTEGVDVPEADRAAYQQALTEYLEAVKAENVLNAEIAADNESSFVKLLAIYNAKRNEAIAAGETTVSWDQEIDRLHAIHEKARTENAGSTSGAGSGSGSGF